MPEAAPVETTPAAPAPEIAPVETAAPVPDAAAPAGDAPATPAEPAKVAEPPKTPVGDKFAVLMRQQAKLREEQKALKAERDALKAERERIAAEAEAKYAPLKALAEKQANAKSDPLGWLEAAGLTPKEVNEVFMNDGKLTPDLAVKVAKAEAKAEADRLRQEFEAREKAAEEKRLAAEKAVIEAKQEEARKYVEEFNRATVDFLTKNVERFELINLYGEQQAVTELMAAQYRATGKILEREEAAQLVEEHLVREVEKGKAAKKFQQSAPQASAGATQPAATPSAQNSRKTLTNDLVGTTASATPKPDGSWEAALAAAEAVMARKAKKPA